VTGASKGIGGGIATALAAAGARVAVNFPPTGKALNGSLGRSSTAGRGDRGRGRRVQGRRCRASIQRSDRCDNQPQHQLYSRESNGVIDLSKHRPPFWRLTSCLMHRSSLQPGPWLRIEVPCICVTVDEPLRSCSLESSSGSDATSAARPPSLMRRKEICRVDGN
jgi:hypothetical protein